MTRRFRPLFGTHGNDLIVGNALIWAALIVAVMSNLQGTVLPSQILPLLVGGAFGSTLLVAFSIRHLLRTTDNDVPDASG